MSVFKHFQLFIFKFTNFQWFQGPVGILQLMMRLVIAAKYKQKVCKSLYCYYTKPTQLQFHILLIETWYFMIMLYLHLYYKEPMSVTEWCLILCFWCVCSGKHWLEIKTKIGLFFFFFIQQSIEDTTSHNTVGQTVHLWYSLQLLVNLSVLCAQ